MKLQAVRTERFSHEKLQQKGMNLHSEVEVNASTKDANIELKKIYGLIGSGCFSPSIARSPQGLNHQRYCLGKDRTERVL